MSLTIALVSSSEMPNGHRQATFIFTFDASYPAGGEVRDISSWFSGSPDLVGQGGDDGYVIQDDRGTAALGKVLAFEAGADAAALDEVTATTDLSAVIVKATYVGVAA